MRPEDLRDLRDAEPFVPFRICLTDGKTYEVRHREFLMIGRTLIILGMASNPETGIYDQIIHISPLHIVRAEQAA